MAIKQFRRLDIIFTNMKNDKLIYYPKTFIWLYLLTLILLVSVVKISLKTKIPIEIFLKDPAVVAGANGLGNSGLDVSLNPLVGIISNVGILIWCISATISFLSFLIVKIDKRKKELANFLIYSTLLTSTLLIDDLFLIHEAIAPKLLRINQEIVYLLLAVATALLMLKFRNTILRTNYILLVAAFILFGLSITLDRIIDLSGNLISLQIELFEDGFKLFGIVSWMAYFLNLFLQEINSLSFFSTKITSTTTNSAKIGSL